MAFTARCNRLFGAILFVFTLIFAAGAQEGPKDSTVLIIRHAENPAGGHGLSPRGEQRAEAYKDYFKNFTVDSKRLEPQAVFAAKDSKQSQKSFCRMASGPIRFMIGSSCSASIRTAVWSLEAPGGSTNISCPETL